MILLIFTHKLFFGIYRSIFILFFAYYQHIRYYLTIYLIRQLSNFYKTKFSGNYLKKVKKLCK